MRLCFKISIALKNVKSLTAVKKYPRFFLPEKTALFTCLLQKLTVATQITWPVHKLRQYRCFLTVGLNSYYYSVFSHSSIHSKLIFQDCMAQLLSGFLLGFFRLEFLLFWFCFTLSSTAAHWTKQHCPALPEELDVSSFFSSSSLSLFSPPVSVPASRSLSVSFDSRTFMVGVLGLLVLFGSLPLRRPPGRFGGVLMRSAVRAAANSFAPSWTQNVTIYRKRTEKCFYLWSGLVGEHLLLAYWITSHCSTK